MNRLPRILADLICCWRDLIRHPREVLLNRAHHQWRGAGLIAVVAVLVVLGVPGFSPTALQPAAVIGGLPWLLDLSGVLAHGLWAKGRIWTGVECQCCGDDPDDDGHDDPDSDAPTDGGGLARDIETWLRNQPTPTH